MIANLGALFAIVHGCFKNRKRPYQYDTKPSYSRRIPIVTAHYFIDVKMYKWSFWGKRNEKLRDIFIQCRILQQLCKDHDKKIGINFRYPIPEDLTWFKRELKKIGIEIFIDGAKDTSL